MIKENELTVTPYISCGSGEEGFDITGKGIIVDSIELYEWNKKTNREGKKLPYIIQDNIVYPDYEFIIGSYPNVILRAKRCVKATVVTSDKEIKKEVTANALAEFTVDYSDINNPVIKDIKFNTMLKKWYAIEQGNKIFECWREIE